MLMLDHSTLFYWTLSDISHNKQKCCSIIKAWASAVPTTKLTSGVNSKSISSYVPSLTTSTSHSSVPSILTDDVKIISHQPGSAKVKSKPGPILSLNDAGGLLTMTRQEEMNGRLGSTALPREKNQSLAR